MRLALAALLMLPGAVSADIARATYQSPTDVYGHGVVPGGEYEALDVQIGERVFRTSAIDERAVYEDTAPRLIDVTGDGAPEVITVISYFDHGAAIRIWEEAPNQKDPEQTSLRVLAEGKPIGTRYRWLAIVGASDLDGDGQIEIAYVDRPHLAKTLRVVNVKGGQLLEKAALRGVTNHRIGEADIAGGIRDCGSGAEMIVANANWSRLLAVTLHNDKFETREIGNDTSRSAFAKAMACD